MNLNDVFGIASSTTFVVVGTREYFEEYSYGHGRVYEQVEYAKRLKKPFRVLLKGVAVAPEGFKEGVKDYREMLLPRDSNSMSDDEGRKVAEFVKS